MQIHEHRISVPDDKLINNGANEVECNKWKKAEDCFRLVTKEYGTKNQ